MSETTMTPSDLLEPPEVWTPARRAARKLVSPIQRFLSIEASSGVLLIIATAIALIWANSPLAGSYAALWHVPVGFEIGGWFVQHSLHYWVNEGLMTIFFFVVGLEIRREIYEGELSNLRRAALPVVAALGGVAVPALIFIALNVGRAGAGGWAVPMATDIAFAVGVLTLLGSRVPNALRVLLLGLAVIDDLIAILVIALFFSAGLSGAGLFIALGGLALVVALRATGARSPALYIVPGIIVWAGLERVGIHPTLAGVILGLLTPVRTWFGPSGFREATRAHIDHLEEFDHRELLGHLDEINRARREAVSVSERLVHILHPYVAYAVMPVFALANAGVDLGAGDLSGDNGWLFWGIVLGLGLGKPIGIIGASLFASRIGVAHGSSDITSSGVAIVGMVGGIGFTMSLFIAKLAFVSGPLLETAKLAILVGSAVAIGAALAYGLLVKVRR
jgi:Na+:H+ antiporter, NhaA family